MQSVDSSKLIPREAVDAVKDLLGLGPKKIDAVMRLVNLPEQGNQMWWKYYNYVHYGDDAALRGYTCTIFGACSGTGSLLDVFEHLQRINPAHKLVKYLPALRKVKGGDLRGIEGLGHVGGDPKKAQPDWKKWSAENPTAVYDHIQGDLATLKADDTDWQRAVWRSFVEYRWKSAAAFVNKTGPCKNRPGPVLTTPLAKAFVVDTCINHGPAEHWEHDEEWKFVHEAKDSADEEAYLSQLIEARRKMLKSGFRGLDWSKTGGRCLLYAKLLQEKNLDLKRPIRCANSPTDVWQPGQEIPKIG